jgi:parallel beta-helix repeat protein
VKRSDLILPIYYIDYPDFNDEERRRHDPLMAEIAKHQYEDWRDLRHESLTSAAIGRKLSRLAETLRDSLDERRPPAMLVGGAPAAAAEPQQRQSPEKGQPVEDTAVQFQEESGAAATPPGTAKPEPPTLVVNQLHRGDHTTIAAAITAAKPGTIVKVEPGLYQEGLVIDRPIEIVGQSAVGDVVIEVADKNAVSFQATMGRVANVTLRQLGGKFYAVDVARGRLDLEDCDITSKGLACVAVHGGADPRVRRNRIHDGKQRGVYVYEQGRGTLEDNEILANALAGVAIATGGDPVLRRNRIDNNAYQAIWVYEGGGGTFEGNYLRDNKRGPWNIAKDFKDKVAETIKNNLGHF